MAGANTLTSQVEMQLLAACQIKDWALEDIVKEQATHVYTFEKSVLFSTSKHSGLQTGTLS